MRSLKSYQRLFQQQNNENDVDDIFKLSNFQIDSLIGLMEHYNMNLTLKVWRQKNTNAKGGFETYNVKDVSSEMSFLEMFDVLNEQLIRENKEPIAFDHDCREGICGMCSMVIDGKPHGPWKENTVCQLHMRAFKDGDTITVEPWRANAFPVIKDLAVDRTSFDRIIQAGGYISVNTGNAVDANALPIEKDKADASFAAAACIGCGACVAACKNSSAMLFLSAKVSHLALLPQGGPERKTRVLDMVAQMDKEGFGACTNTGACEATCPKGISLSNIARLNQEYLLASLTSDK
jgi:succinate dehydrogenase / fumarate reductase iron-sulfur subunit